MTGRLHLFQAYGIELEYMIVDKDTLAVKPISDELLKYELGTYGGDFENGMVTWSNELVLHVIEVKCTQPESDLPFLESAFVKNLTRINSLLSNWNAMLLPTAAHPFMNPEKETRLWPHDNNEVYEIYNKIFGCRGHGWSNLQSTHLNLPFANDEEFGKLHAAIRVVLPLLPALCASSPILEGKISGVRDTRLTFYKSNQARIPSITGAIVPESVYSEKEHRAIILDRIENDIAPFNEDDILDPVWVNSRGAMSRFDRGSIEIRIMDIQECPKADLAIVTFVIELLKALTQSRFASVEDQQKMQTENLAAMLDKTIREGQQAILDDPAFLTLFSQSKPVSALHILREIFHKLTRENNIYLQPFEKEISIILEHGTLSDRIVKGIGSTVSPDRIQSVYRQLASCLAQNQLFIP